VKTNCKSEIQNHTPLSIFDYLKDKNRTSLSQVYHTGKKHKKRRYFLQYLLFQTYYEKRNYLDGARLARNKREYGSFYGQNPKNEPPHLPFCERSKQKDAKPYLT
jgi:hypothetical protein